MSLPRQVCTLTSYSLLLAAAAASFTLPQTLGIPAAMAWPEPPEVVHLAVVVRDFRVSHPDFRSGPASGHVAGLVDSGLGADGLPLFIGTGRLVMAQAIDGQGRSIAPHIAAAELDWLQSCREQALTDVAARLSEMRHTGGVTSRTTFGQWWSDVHRVNLSSLVPLALVRQPSGTYLFDDRLDPLYAALGGYFPIEARLFGMEGEAHNFEFTSEFAAEFTYDRTGGQFIEYTGDGDAWAYIDAHLVLDAGGSHDGIKQRIDIDRLCLPHGRTYTLRFFHAERRRPESHLRLETNLLLRGIEGPGTQERGTP